MKLIMVLALVTAVVARPDDKYDDRYDNFNIEELISNARLLRAYAECIQGVGKCTPDGNNFKKLMPDAVETNCAKCTDKQKVLSAKGIKAMKETIPDEFEKIYKIYDPDHKKTSEFNAFVNKYAA